ncbi:MAG: hypothetical protein U0414_41120 [Polyangiaceae bacterium]
MAAPLAGCRVTEEDLRKWEHLEHGPPKLQAVLYYPKYDDALRLQAALALIRVPPHSYVDAFDTEGPPNTDGITGLVRVLARLPQAQHDSIVAALVPELVKELTKDPPIAQDDKHAPPDPSFPFKDAAYAILVYGTPQDKEKHEGRLLVQDEALRAQLMDALVFWATADFENRLENRSQKYAMESLLEMVGAPGVAGLPKLMTRDARFLDREASLVAKHGTTETKEAASAALVAIAKYIISDEWKAVMKPKIEEANRLGGIVFDESTPEKAEQAKKRFDKQMELARDEELIRLYGSMLRIGGRATTEWAFEFAKVKEQSSKRRAGALATLEQKLDIKEHPKDLDTLIALIKSPDSPNEVIDQAFRRISELPREKVIGPLYDLFAYDKWPVRRAAESNLLKLIFVPELDGFFKKLPEKDNGKGFSMLEAITSSANMHDMKASKDAKEVQPGEVPPALPVIKSFLDPKATPAQRSTAFSYFITWGTKADLDLLKPYEEDKGVVPVCDTDADCKWSCIITTEQGDKLGENDQWSISGYDPQYLTGDRFEDILKAQRFTDTSRDAKKGFEGVIEFKAKRDGISYVFTLAPWVSNKDKDGKAIEGWKAPEPIKAADISKFNETGATRAAGMVVLVAESAKKEDAQAVLSDLVRKNKDIKTVGEFVKHCVEPRIIEVEKQKAQEKK